MIVKAKLQNPVGIKDLLEQFTLVRLLKISPKVRLHLTN